MTFVCLIELLCTKLHIEQVFICQLKQASAEARTLYLCEYIIICVFLAKGNIGCSQRVSRKQCDYYALMCVAKPQLPPSIMV